MDDVEVLRLAAFTGDPDGGNPAGVVVTDEPLDEGRMLAIAADVGYSETAFLVPARAGGADGGVEVAGAAGAGRYTVRYFSPRVEVPFCGHATVAAAVALAGRDRDLTRLDLATANGPVRVDVDRRGPRLRATLTSPPARSVGVPDDVLDAALDCLGWDRTVLDEDLEPAVASAGATHLVLPLARRSDLRALDYRYDCLEALSVEHGWVTVHVVWRESPDRYHARDPFPAGGVVEDPATGAAAAAFGGYLRERGLLPAGGAFTIVQGEDMGRRSVLSVSAPAGLDGVRVSGEAVRLP